jgi:hypothetical protein
MVVYDLRTITVVVERRDSVYICIMRNNTLIPPTPVPTPGAKEEDYAFCM